MKAALMLGFPRSNYYRKIHELFHFLVNLKGEKTQKAVTGVIYETTWAVQILSEIAHSS